MNGANRVLDHDFVSLESAVDHLSREHHHLRERVSILEQRVVSLEQPKGPTICLGHSDEDASDGFIPPLGTATLESFESGLKAQHMCDYCYKISANCFNCPRCGHEWYCSKHCQRLRGIVHEHSCRNCCKTI
ncbi:unnamed protein product [Phytomonas sp. EM1]|nr:unnamed protein product [Phytomonas sp. EM1]|eukprot:CCW62914.1 unnamed protein product [Phytomonas sp. isolate EM1]